MLLERRHWIFDMDGTLTRGIHDFAAIRTTLGLPPDQGILESLRALEPSKAAKLHARLHDIEHKLALRSEAEPDALGLVKALSERGHVLGVLTRNTVDLAHITLEVSGMAPFFDPVLGRDCADPKPSPDGLQKIMKVWGAAPEDTVMVGDYLFDIEAGKAAGTATVLIDREGLNRWPGVADRTVRALTELLA